MRDRAWRRWRWEVITERVRKHHSVIVFYDADTDHQWTYQKKTSVNETVEVQVLCESHHEEFVRLLIRKHRDTRAMCSCWACGNPRNMGYGNSNKTLTFKEAKALSEGVREIEQSNVFPPNSLWRRRSFRCK